MYSAFFISTSSSNSSLHFSSSESSFCSSEIYRNTDGRNRNGYPFGNISTNINLSNHLGNNNDFFMVIFSSRTAAPEFRALQLSRWLSTKDLNLNLLSWRTAYSKCVSKQLSILHREQHHLFESCFWSPDKCKYLLFFSFVLVSTHSWGKYQGF